MITLCPLGDYAHRQPLAYPQIRAHCLGRVRVVDDPARADVLTLSHTKDLDRHGARLKGLMRPDQRLVLLSEEPFWDTVWGHDPLRREQEHATEAGPLRLTVLNHHTSTLYDFREIPYFLLTDHRFSTRYARWFSRNARRRPEAWRERLAGARWQAAFMLARRQSPRYEIALPQAQVLSLCNQRTRVAEACLGPEALHHGQGWGDIPARQALDDWHLEKFLALDGQCRFVSAIENTHQHPYVSEKIFDAYAAGAVPLYMAGPRHRVHDIAPDGLWLNLLDVPPEETPARMAGFAEGMDAAFFEAYAALQARLARLFADPAPLQRELGRLRDALAGELAAVLDS